VSEPRRLKFVHRFSRSLVCEMTVEDKPPGAGTSLSLNHEWTGRPKRKHAAAYRQWTLTAIQLLADRWQCRILYALGIAPNRTELWAFEPGAAPKLLRKLNCGIP
jgi:hypothetical protein